MLVQNADGKIVTLGVKVNAMTNTLSDYYIGRYMP